MLLRSTHEPEQESASAVLPETQLKSTTTKKKPKAQPKPTSTKIAGMGAIVHEKGTAFRVWAPNASKVFVTGMFNGWSEKENPLEKEENGYWYTDIPGAKAGEEYKYMLMNGRKKLFRNDPYAREVSGSEGNSIIPNHDFDWEDDHIELPAWHELIIYELHIGTFNTSEEGKPGTLYDTIEKLPYLHDLGINAIKIMPLAEFPGGFSWGYNPSHPFALEGQYGGPNGLKELVKAAHKLGIAIILDVVYNHFGPDRLDLWQFDGWSEDDGGGIYFYNDWRSCTPWGNTRPDYGRAEVRQYLRDNALMWLDEYHLDGLRVDSVSHIRNVCGHANDPANDLPDGWSLLQWINEEINQRYPWKLTIAEDPNGNEWLTKDTGAGGAGFDMQWDNAYVHTIHDAVVVYEDEARNMEAVADVLRHRFNTDAFKRVIYTESHDEVANGGQRIPEEIEPGNVGNYFSKKRSTLGIGLLLTSPGTPMLFQGQELLADKSFDDKEPIDWSRAETFSGLVSMFRDLIRLRRNMNGNTRGLTGHEIDVYHINQVDKVLAYHRWNEGGAGDSVIVVANMTNRRYDAYRIGFPTEGNWKVRFNSDWEGYDAEFTNHFSYDTTAVPDMYDGLPFSGNVGLGPYSVLIFSQD